MKAAGYILILGSLLLVVWLVYTIASEGKRHFRGTPQVHELPEGIRATVRLGTEGDEAKLETGIIDLALSRQDRELTDHEWDLVVERAEYDYVVQEGDSLERLAAKYLGDAERITYLLRANPHLSEGTTLVAGETVLIPLSRRLR